MNKRIALILYFVIISIQTNACPDISNLKINGPQTVCYNTTGVEFTVDSLPNCSYKMTAKAGEKTLILNNISSYRSTINITQTNDFTISCEINNGCTTQTVSQTTSIDTTIAKADLTVIGKSLPLRYCKGKNINFTNPTFTDFTLDFYPANSMNYNQVFPTYTLNLPTQAGNYSIQATFNGNCGEKIKKWDIIVFDNPKIEPIIGKNKICTNSLQTYKASATWVDSAFWSCGAKRNTIKEIMQNGVTIHFADSLKQDTIRYLVKNTCGEASVNMPVEIKQPYREELGIASAYDDGRSHAFVAWNRTSNKGTSFYEVYREVETNIYRKIGKKRMDEIAIWIDDTSDVWKQAYTYKLRTYDTCGNYTESDPIRTMHLRITKQNDNHRLDWNSYISKETTKYLIYEVNPDFSRTQIGQVPASKGIQEFSFVINSPKPKAVYRVGYATQNINPTAVKTDTGPFSQSFSNMSEASLVDESMPPHPLIAIFPNPAHSFIEISAPSNAQISIKSATANEIFSEKTEESKLITIPCLVWARGIYIIQIHTTTNYWEEKIIIE